ncbi:MAG: acetyl-CoA carboxylase biotin carboxylase subunit [Candidatus Eisenbacteria bacterium]|nr:acetyl-CoA carboxylase biotin carboxylase subunit [Candidatus Eisenbacteria bacterium]
MFKRILIANRGEIALRVIRAARQLGVESVAVYSEADRESPHLEQADQRVCIGPPKSAESYLDMPAIIQAAEQHDCCAIHPGYGFLAENALFAELCEQAKMSFIGPPAAAIRAMGDKATARETMRAAGLPVIPGSRGTLRNIEQGLTRAKEIGFPVILKATAGGGGKGMRRVNAEEEFAAKYRDAALEAEKAFSNPGLYMEKYIVDGRHIEFQVMADAFGNAVHLGERECSAQRRHQKLVEESPSPVMTPELRDELGEKLRRALQLVGYRNAGTVEFFRDQDGHLYFMEMNARLQVEHPVTEQVTGRDLVVEQIRIAANEELSFDQQEITMRGHSIECRINAEDPYEDFRPSPGLVETFQPPSEIEGARVRIDSHVRPGYRIPVYYDSLIAKLIVWGQDRDAAREAMIDALERFEVGGVKTTIPVHLQIMRNEQFAAGDYDTGFIERLLG